MIKQRDDASHRRLYRIYVDESGDHTYYSLDDHGRRYFGLTGCIIEAEYYRSTFHPAVEDLKVKHFSQDPDNPVILHRDDIINRRKSFWPLRDPVRRNAFDEDILRFISEMDYVLITVVIDKKVHMDRYGEAAFHPYHFCLTMLLERYCGFLNFHNGIGDVMAESRQGKEDAQLRAAYTAVYDSGTRWRGTDFFRRALSSKKLKLKQKLANIAGLQLADLLAHPSKQEILIGERRIERLGSFGLKISRAIENKYNRHVYEGRVTGYGKVFLNPDFPDSSGASETDLIV